MARDDFPAPSEGFVLTHFIVADDVARSRDFYTGVLGGTAVMDGEPTIVKLDPPRRRLEGQPCQVRQVGARDRARRARGQPRLAPLPRPALCHGSRRRGRGACCCAS
jgi:catechol 2,3-dioxygenase-like lactoylglutathione lyase family enzyme